MPDREPPGGTVSFLFTDIESSTWLLQHLGDDYDSVLHTHERLLREKWDAHHGYEVNTGGDSFFVAFADAASAVRAALDAQHALASHTWPDGAVVRVRMGIHTGEARVHGDDYVGLAVHQAARISSAAHGGQVLVSEATRVQAGSDIDFRDLGLHRLKDLAEPARLYQIVDPELPSEFPPPRTLTVMPNNFPLQLTTFVGREDDITEVQRLLGSSRLVTLTGAGGVGKTRLALQVGAEAIDDFADGAWLVDLAPLSDPSVVPGSVAGALGVRDQPGREITDSLVDHLVGKRLLIVLDNCEHLIDACAKLVHKLLSVCPNVRILATSREVLNVGGEAVWQLRSLAVPDERAQAVDELMGAESIRLFVQRARAVRTDFELTASNAVALAQVCRRLDGLPLAIELAAARVRAMSVPEIAEKLDDRFRLLTGGSRTAMPRQRTLEAAVSWSYNLLSEPERLLFEQLSVFAGGCTLEAAETVCVGAGLEAFQIADLVTSLVDRSLVVTDATPTGGTRYRMLETLRQFGRDRLVERDETAALRDRHLAWAVSVAERWPPMERGIVPSLDLVAEKDNLWTAIEWAIETGDEVSALRIASSARPFHFDEQARLWDRLLPPGPDVPTTVAAKALFSAGGMAFMRGEWAPGVELLHTSAEANAAVGDATATAMSLIYEGACTWGLGDVDAAAELAGHGLDEAIRGGSVEGQVRALLLLAWVETERDLSKAERLASEGIERAAQLDNDFFELGHLREVLAYVHCLAGDVDKGALVLADAVSLYDRIQRNCASHVLETCAAWAAMTQRFDLGAELLGAAARVRGETGDKPRPWERLVQQNWLPRIGERLGPDTFEAAKRRGRARDGAEALAFAERTLREATS